MHEYTVEHLKEKRALCPESSISVGFFVVSSTDHPFAISDTLKKCLQETKESLLISAPYIGKISIDMIRVVPEGTTVRLLTRRPDEKDYKTIRALESFTEIANSSGLKLSVTCKPYLHAKFIVIDDRKVLSGSVNPTSSGIYDNDELLYVFKNPTDVKRHIKIFDNLWNCPRNTTWENVQLFSGHKGYGDRNLIYKKIAEAIIGYFHKNDNQAVDKSVLCEQIAKRGFNKNAWFKASI